MLAFWILRGCFRITIGDLVGTASLNSLTLTTRMDFAVPCVVLVLWTQSFVMLRPCHSDSSCVAHLKMYIHQSDDLLRPV